MTPFFGDIIGDKDEIKDNNTISENRGLKQDDNAQNQKNFFKKICDRCVSFLLKIIDKWQV